MTTITAPAITTTVETIDPKKAEQLLGLNTKNRALSKAYVNELAGRMSRGEWLTNGQAIVISREGVLVDGQHRLHAVIKSGVPIRTNVVRGVDGESFATIDIGHRRQCSDVLAMNGHVNGKRLAATITMLEHFHRGKLSEMNKAQSRVTPATIMDLAAKYPDLISSCRFIERHVKGLTTASTAAAHYLFRAKDKDAADEFIEGLVTGKDLSGNDPRLSLRDRLIGMAMQSRLPRSPVVLALLIKAWNAWQQGKSGRGIIQVRTAGPSAETDYPVVL